MRARESDCRSPFFFWRRPVFRPIRLVEGSLYFFLRRGEMGAGRRGLCVWLPRKCVVGLAVVKIFERWGAALSV